MSDSRTLTELADCIEFFDLEKGKERYAAWIAMLMGKYGYKTKRALFKDMKNCGIHLVNGVITISPTRHEKLEAWGRTKGDGLEDVILSLDCSPAEIGAGLRLALSRCKGLLYISGEARLDWGNLGHPPFGWFLIYRPPVSKKSQFAITGVQANFQILDKSGVVISNGHLNITK